MKPDVSISETQCAPAAQQIIRLRRVSRTYPMSAGTVTPLDDVSLDIAQGEFVAIMRTLGSGKSTMMNMIGALDVPTSGWLLIDGHEVAQLSAGEQAVLRNRTIGFVFQQFNLLPRTTALQQVMLPCLYTRPRVRD